MRVNYIKGAVMIGIIAIIGLSFPILRFKLFRKSHRLIDVTKRVNKVLDLIPKSIYIIFLISFLGIWEEILNICLIKGFDIISLFVSIYY